MDKNWTKINLGKILKIKHGFPFKGEYFEEKGKYIILTPGNFYEEGGFKYQIGKEKYYSGEFPKSYIHKKGDLIVAMTEQAHGLLGSCAFVPEDNLFLHNQRLGLIEVLDDTLVDKTFIYYLFKTKYIRTQISLTSTGSKVKHTSPERIYNVKCFLPSFYEQQKIASVLSSLDKKIELNNKMNQELEKMAKTLYDYWFVQFDFPNEEGKPYKSSGGEMVYNKELKREIPKGWEIVYLDDVLEFEKGIEPGSLNYKKIPINKNDIPFFKVADMNGQIKTYIDKDLVQNTLVKENDILVSFDGTVGKIAIGLNGSYSSGIRKIYQKDKLFFPKSFIYEVFKSEEIQQTIKKYATGSNILHAGSSIKNLKIAYDEKLVKQYDLIVKDIFKKLIINIQQNKELTNLKDWLLPMLMNGQVKVK